MLNLFDFDMNDIDLDGFLGAEDVPCDFGLLA
jgi:hypothetical protein